MHISAPTNLQKESLSQEIITFIKQYGKTGIKNIMKNTYATFFTIWNLKSEISYKFGRVVVCLTSVAIHYCYFHILLCTMHYTFQRLFLLYVNWSQSKTSVVKQMSHHFFEAQKYFFTLFNFLKMVIFTTLFQHWSTLWNSTLKITALFQCCLTLLILTLK